MTGSDSKDSPVLESLRALGIPCFVGHRAEQVDGADTVVISTAVRDDNDEVARARELGLRVWPRSAAVQSLLRDHTAVVVTGTHGKTTTTSMLVSALIACDADPSYAIGSTLLTTGVNAAAGAGPVFVAEGDESDQAILVYTPFGAVVTNIDADHLDHYGTREAYAAVFDAFLARIEPGGFLVCCVDDPGASRLAGLAATRELTVVTVGTRDGCELQARGLAFSGMTSAYDVWDGSKSLGVVTLQVPGRAYVVDSLAALAAGLQLGYRFEELALGLAGFQGSGRRMEIKGRVGDITVYDSYAHHPVEIAADLEAARGLVADGRLVVLFQPHLVSRTRVFGAEMGAALAAADQVVVMDIYLAREQADPAIDGSLVAEAVPLPPEQVHYEPVHERVPRRMVELVRSGDVVLTLGAGDVTELGPKILALLEKSEARR
ncbi:MAG: UDP-N-acetylmuramate--L-alanine ligase [Nocardioidaceae bacterium]